MSEWDFSLTLTPFLSCSLKKCKFYEGHFYICPVSVRTFHFLDKFMQNTCNVAYLIGLLASYHCAFIPHCALFYFFVCLFVFVLYFTLFWYYCIFICQSSVKSLTTSHTTLLLPFATFLKAEFHIDCTELMPWVINALISYSSFTKAFFQECSILLLL